MQKKQSVITPRSIQRDTSVSVFPNTAAYDMLNLRLNTIGSNTTYNLSNESGNSAVTILSDLINLNEDEDFTILGTQIINDVVVLFIHKSKNKKVTSNPDYIIKTDLKDIDNSSILYNGNLNLNVNNPIESVGIYENENIKKIYWVDGINQPRMINIERDYHSSDSEFKASNIFDFNPALNISHTLNFSVDVVEDSNGNFPAGVVQYVIAYFNKNGQQTGAVFQSPLYYTSNNGKGLNPDGSKKSSQAFRITVKDLYTGFEYIRIYRILRTSLDVVPSVSYLGEYKTNTTYNDIIKSPTLNNSESNSFILQYGGNIGCRDGNIDNLLIIGQEGKIKRISSSQETGMPCAIINPLIPIEEGDIVNPLDNLPFIIKDTKNNTTYNIPANKTLLVSWVGTDLNYDIGKAYTIGIAAKDNYFLYSDERMIGEKPKPGVQVIDTNTSGVEVDPKELLLLGGDVIKPKTITHKDNTLFLGNYTIDSYHIDAEVKQSIKNSSSVMFNFENVYEGGDDNSTLSNQWIHNSNLSKGSDKITYFQKGEVYRVGVQMLHKQGGWSEAIWLGDFENTLRVISNRFNDGIKSKPVIKASIPLSKIPEDYIALRLLCVYPSINDRNVLCQGIVCPTVYNVGDRNDNSPYVQSSWFARPKPLFRWWKSLGDRISINHRKGGVVCASMTNLSNDDADFIYGSDSVLGEIYGASSPSRDIIKETPKIERVNKYKNLFGIDERIVTMHSPELDPAYNEELYNTSLDGVKFRIVGVATVKDTISDIKINASQPFTTKLSKSYNTNIEDNSTANHLSNRSMINFPFWVDGVSVNTNETSPGDVGKNLKGAAAFPIYPWHRKGSLSNQGKVTGEGTRKSLLDSKIMSNLRVCLPTLYLENTNVRFPYEMPISNVELFNSNQITNKEIHAWGKSIIYRGNIDKILSCDGDGEFDETEISVPNSGSYHDYSAVNIDVIQGIPTDSRLTDYVNISSSNGLDTANINDFNKFNSDPIPIQYKSTGHAVFAFNKEGSKYVILPRVDNGVFNNIDESFDYVPSDDDPLLWLSEDEKASFGGLSQHLIEINNDEDVLNNSSYMDSDGSLGVGYKSPSTFLLGELYRDNVLNRFGGTSEQALSNNIWTVCGNTKYIDSNESLLGDGYITLTGDQGDTYYERYDHLKTYPSAPENTNSIVDIVSFMCETRINIDGRYDSNRGKKNNLAVSPINFNLFNKVYSQKNNFFTYNYLRDDDIYTTDFPNQIIWSKAKTLGENIDSWTNIKTINALDLDGDKGEIQSLNRLNNEIYAFQDSGVSRILFNSRAAIPVSDGVPIEIANGGKVEGKVYLNDSYGCQNKWSIAETPSGIYFTDNKTNGIYLFNGQNIVNISDSKGMYSWSKNNITDSKWNPKTFDNIRTLYDNVTGDVYFTTKDKALAFNEKMQAFTSFYSYGGVDWIINLNDEAYQINNYDFNNKVSRLTKIWKMHDVEADNCNFFGSSEPYYIEVIANPDFQQDKIIDTLEFRTNDTVHFKYNKVDKDSYGDIYPFQTIEVSNEYQYGKGNTSTLKKRFRTWRWALPRSKRDRIRNPWAYIKMTCNADSSYNPFSIYDMVLTYYLV